MHLAMALAACLLERDYRLMGIAYRNGVTSKAPVPSKDPTMEANDTSHRGSCARLRNRAKTEARMMTCTMLRSDFICSKQFHIYLSLRCVRRFLESENSSFIWHAGSGHQHSISFVSCHRHTFRDKCVSTKSSNQGVYRFSMSASMTWGCFPQELSQDRACRCPPFGAHTSVNLHLLCGRNGFMLYDLSRIQKRRANAISHCHQLVTACVSRF
jgi:hypothetical protein